MEESASDGRASSPVPFACQPSDTPCTWPECFLGGGCDRSGPFGPTITVDEHPTTGPLL